MDCAQSARQTFAGRLAIALRCLLMGLCVTWMPGPKAQAFTIDIAIPENPAFDTAFETIQAQLQGTAVVRRRATGESGEVINNVIDGQSDIAIVPVSALTKMAPALSLYELPFTFTRMDAYVFSRTTDLNETASAQLKTHNLQSLGGIWYGGSRVFVSQLPRRSPADFKGAVVAVGKESAGLDGWSDVGARPVRMSETEMISALTEGRVDVAEVPYAQLLDLNSGFVIQSDHRFTSLIAIRNSTRNSPLSEQDNERVLQTIEHVRQTFSMGTIEGEEDAQYKTRGNPRVTWMTFDTGGNTDWQAAIAKSEAPKIKTIGTALVEALRNKHRFASYELSNSKDFSMYPNGSDPAPLGPSLSINWNAWFQSSPNHVKDSLEVGKPYDFLLDLGRGFYPGALGGAISPALSKEIESQSTEAEIHLLVRPVLLGAMLKAAPGKDLRAQRFTVHLDRLASKAQDESLREQARQNTLSLNDLAAALSTDKPLNWSLIARHPGCAQVALSIWDASGLRPLDYIVVSVPVNKPGESRNDCYTGLKGGELVSGIERLLDLGKGQTQSLSADAALHVFDSIPEGQGKPSTVAVLVDRSKFSADETIFAWELGSNWKQFQDVNLPKSLENTHKRLRTAQPYTEVVQQLNNALFNGKETADQDAANAAQSALKQLGQRTDNPVILVRYFDPWGEMQSLPLGLLGTNAPGRVFSRRVTVIQPLQDARQTDPDSCFSGWDFAIPKELDDVDADSAELLLQDSWRMQGADIKWYQSNTDLLNFVIQPGSTRPQSSALVLLAHHGKGGITFSRSGLPDTVLSSDVKRRFVPGSIAILAACSMLGGAIADRTFIDMLVDRGVSAVIASPFAVDSDFGTRLSISFVAVAEELRDSKTSVSLLEIFNRAVQKTIDAYGQTSGYADMALELQIIGDPQLQMCKAPLASSPVQGVQP